MPESGGGGEEAGAATAATVTPNPAETSITQHFALDSNDISAISVLADSPASKGRRPGWAEISEEELLGESCAKIRRVGADMEVEEVAT